MNDNLKPCPFCGGEAHLEENEGDFLIACNQCQSAIIPPGEEPGATATEQEAINAWNRRASGWISVEDRLPMPYDVVLISVATKNGYDKPIALITLGCYENDRWLQVGCDRGYELSEGEHITHWMPLPEPPKKEDRA